MDIRADARFPCPREVVFKAYRDELLSLLPYLPNVRGIEIKSRTEDGPVVQFVNLWRGGGEIPAAARAILSESMLSWDDHAKWDERAFVCDWRIETHSFTEAVRCLGRNSVLEDGPGKTLLEIRGSLDIDAKKIRGVPGFLAGKVGRTIEEFLLNKIQPNLIETAKGLERFLSDKKA